MNKILFCFLLMVIFQFFAHAQVDSAIVKFDTIAGPLPSLVKAQSKPYLVISNVEVGPDKIVTVEPGVVFLFRNFTGLHVRGKLIALGTKDKPIVFTSENDRAFNPGSKREANPYDWDGVYLNADAIGSQFSFCKLKYSVYALNSETKFIRIQPMLLQDNGKEFVTIENIEHTASEGPFSYVLERKDVLADGVPIDLFKDPLAVKRNTIRYVSVALFAASAAASGYFGYEAYSANQNLISRSDTTFANLNNPNGTKDWQSIRDQKWRNITYLSASTVLSLLASTGFYWTFTF